MRGQGKPTPGCRPYHLCHDPIVWDLLCVLVRAVDPKYDNVLYVVKVIRVDGGRRPTCRTCVGCAVVPPGKVA
jgi:hypothetical protein